MCAPIAVPTAALGALLTHHHSTRVKGFGARGSLASIALLPLLILAEHASAPPPAAYPVSTAVEVDAPPSVVWRHVVEFTELPPPTEALFRAGIAYPIRAEIDGRGVGAVRRCVFSTGQFVEPITTWDEPRLLAFSVDSNPPPMQEWTPYDEIRPPHLEGYLEAHRGQFELEPLPGGRTRLVGTTWYSHGLRPGPYWKLWSDAILHRIHLRVLRHIARESAEDRWSRISGPDTTGSGLGRQGRRGLKAS